MLLGAVVDVTLEPTPLCVVGVDEAAPRLLQLVRSYGEVGSAPRELGTETAPMEDHPGLGGEVGEQTLLDRPEGPVLPFAHPQRAEVLAVEHGRRVRGHRPGACRGAASAGQVAASSSCAVDHQPDLGPGRAGPGREVSGQPGREVEDARLRVVARVGQ